MNRKEILGRISKEALESIQFQLNIAKDHLSYPGMYFRQSIEQHFEDDKKEGQLIYNTILLFEPKYLKGALFCDIDRKNISLLTEEEIQETINFINGKPIIVFG